MQTDRSVGESSVPNAFVQKLGRRAVLGAEDLSILEAACATARHYPAKQNLIREGDAPGPAFVFLAGWGYRYKLLPEGGRQVLAFLMPGDFCDLNTTLLNEMDHTIATVTPSLVVATVTPSLVVAIPRLKMQEMAQMRPAISKAFRLIQLVDLALARSWIANIGRRGSAERLAHLICEIYHRANQIRPIGNGQCAMPISQILLADALGLTPVHVNRVLRAFKTAGVMKLERGELIITDLAELVRIAGFSDSYLQRKNRSARSNSF